MQHFLVVLMRTQHFNPELIKPHYAHLDDLKARGLLEAHGPFGDKSGGAYLLLAESLEQARAMAFADPLHVSGSSEVSVREWNATQVK